MFNSLGVAEERNNFTEALRKFISDKKSELSEDSKKRLDTNVLRILDSKDNNDQKLLQGAPVIKDFLGKDSLDHFNTVKELLTTSKIPFKETPY